MILTRNALSTTQLCSLHISPPTAETDLAGNCISLQCWAMAILVAGLVAWEGSGISPLLSSPHFLISHVCPPFPSLFPPHFLVVRFSHTYLFLRSFVSLFLLSHGPPPPLSDAYLLSFTVSICFVSNSISLLLGLFLSFCIRLSLSPFLYFPLSPLLPSSVFLTPHPQSLAIQRQESMAQERSRLRAQEKSGSNGLF